MYHDPDAGNGDHALGDVGALLVILGQASPPPSATPAWTARSSPLATTSTKRKEFNPARWSGTTRDWTPIDPVTLNPERDATVTAAPIAEQKTGEAA